MKILTRVLLAFLVVQGLAADFCKRPLMNAYQLEGILEPNQQKNPLCGSIKNNCCTTDDMLKVLGMYNNQLKPKLAEHKEKFNKSVYKLRRLHQLILALKERTDYQGNQKLYCASSLKKVSEFDLQGLIEELLIGFSHASDYFVKVHTGLLCTFCDYDAQAQIILSTKQVGVDSSVCLDALNQLKDFLITQNILLVDYFKRVQTHLDCMLFDNKYNLPFTFGRQAMLAVDFEQCFEKLTPESLDKKCEPMCNHLHFGAISPVFEGNWFLIERALKYMRDQIDSIKTKESMTPFDPLGALRQINQVRENLVFTDVTEKKKKSREELQLSMKVPNNNYTVAESNLDDVERNDLTAYAATEREDNIDRAAERNVTKFGLLNSGGWDEHYRSVFNPNSTANADSAVGSPGSLIENLTTEWSRRVRRMKQNKIAKKQSKSKAKGKKRTRKLKAQKVAVRPAMKKPARLTKLGSRTTKSKGVLAKNGHKRVFNDRKVQKKSSKASKLAPKKAYLRSRKLLIAKVSPSNDALEKNAFKSILGKKIVPAQEEKLLEKMAKIIDSEFNSKAAKSLKSSSISKTKRHVRILEELMSDEELSLKPSAKVPNGRMLVEVQVDPRLRNPLTYFTKFYDSIEFFLNSTSLEISKVNSNTPDLTTFTVDSVVNAGVNLFKCAENSDFDMTPQALQVKIKGQSNADPADSTMNLLIRTVGIPTFVLESLKALSTECTIIVKPEFQSENDKDLLRAEPHYEKEESFDIIDRRFFSDDFISDLRFSIPNAYLKRKAIPRNLRDVSTGRRGSLNRQLHSRFTGSIHPSLLVAHRRGGKDLF